MKKFKSKEVPQANDIERAIEIIYSIKRLNVKKPRYINLAYDLVKNNSSFVKKKHMEDFIKDGISIAYKRDVAYYKDSVDILNLASENLLLSIDSFCRSSQHTQRLLIRDAILNSDIYKAYLKNKDFKSMRKLVYTPEESLKKYGSKKFGLVDKTLKRRISCLKAWDDYCSFFEKGIVNGIESKIILIEKDNQKLERAVNSHKKLVSMMLEALKSHDAQVYEDQLVDLVYFGEEKIFFEMKSITEENKGSQLKKAIGQLIFYKNYYNSMNTKLVIVLEKYFSDVDILINDNIDVIWKDGYFFNSDEKTKKKLKIIFNESN
jgi:hypothetical protein